MRTNEKQIEYIYSIYNIYKSNKKKRIITISTSAVCLTVVAIIMYSATNLNNNSGSLQNSLSNAVTNGENTSSTNNGDANIIWGSTIVDFSLDSSNNMHKLTSDGRIMMTETLHGALNNPDNIESIFAIYLHSEINREIIYNEFIKPLNIEEDFLKNGIVFLSKAQFENIMYPQNMSITFALAPNPNIQLGDNVIIDETYLSNMKDDDIIKVQINLLYNQEELEIITDETPYMIEVSPGTFSGYTEEYMANIDYYRTERNKRIRKFYDAYRIPVEKDYSLFHENNTGLTITCDANKILLQKLLSDNRIDNIYLLEPADNAIYDRPGDFGWLK